MSAAEWESPTRKRVRNRKGLHTTNAKPCVSDYFNLINIGVNSDTCEKITADYFLPGDLEHQIEAFVDHYNNRRYHESLGNLTPADVYFGRCHAIIERRAKIRDMTLQNRRLLHRLNAA